MRFFLVISDRYAVVTRYQTALVFAMVASRLTTTVVTQAEGAGRGTSHTSGITVSRLVRLTLPLDIRASDLTTILIISSTPRVAKRPQTKTRL